MFPDHKLTWERFEGELDVPDLPTSQKEESEQKQDDTAQQEDEEEEKNESRKDKRIQPVDAACGGLIFYRFKVDVKPTDFVAKLFQHMLQLDSDERKQQANKIRHCAVSNARYIKYNADSNRTKCKALDTFRLYLPSHDRSHCSLLRTIKEGMP